MSVTAQKIKAIKDLGYKLTVGLEIHAQLNIPTKLFSRGATSFQSIPNSKVNLVDAAHPGALPVLSSEAVDSAILTGLSLNGKINPVSRFDRKHYFYFDLPQAYQITQQDYPLMTGGEVTVTLDKEGKEPQTIHLEGMKIEQDSGKTIHDSPDEYSLVDLNRCGSSLVEIVTLPEIHSPEVASAIVKKLQHILRSIGTCSANLEQGNMRCDVNISVSKDENKLGQRCEVKNLNSISNLVKSINYEMIRQVDLIEKNQPIILETRTFDAKKGQTIPIRSKETDTDYRFFPEPDLPPLFISPSRLAEIQKQLPELPDQEISRLMKDYSLKYSQASLLSESAASHFFQDVVSQTRNKILSSSANSHTKSIKDSKIISSAFNWIVNDLFGKLRSQHLHISSSPVSSTQISELLLLLLTEKTNGRIAKQLMWEMFITGRKLQLKRENENINENETTKKTKSDAASLLQSLLDLQHPDALSFQESDDEFSLFHIFPPVLDGPLPTKIINKKKWNLIEDAQILEPIIKKHLESYPELQQYINGNKKVRSRLSRQFLGMIMNSTEGLAHPNVVSRILPNILKTY